MLGERMAMGRSLEVGDQGIWVTYARGMKSKAIRELNELCEEVSWPPPAKAGKSRYLADHERSQFVPSVWPIHVWNSTTV